jgi:hypothetical protein
MFRLTSKRESAHATTCLRIAADVMHRNWTHFSAVEGPVPDTRRVLEGCRTAGQHVVLTARLLYETLRSTTWLKPSTPFTRYEQRVPAVCRNRFMVKRGESSCE